MRADSFAVALADYISSLLHKLTTLRARGLFVFIAARPGERDDIYLKKAAQ